MPSTPASRDSVRRLRRVALAGPLLLVLLVEAAHWLVLPSLSPWSGLLLVVTLALVFLAAFYDRVFRRVEEVESRLVRQNDELRSLHEAGLAVTADLSLDTVLQTVVDRACALVGTRYGALSVVDGEARITHFITAGVEPDLREKIGEPPHGRGILAVALREGQRLRLDDVREHPAYVGFPEHHPPMRTLLAVPIVCNGPHRGNLYLSEKRDGGGFTADDEEVLARFASQVAIAIDNAHLHQEVRELGAARERLRIAHEMHDGLAQVLGFVNTKTQVVDEYLRQERGAEARKHLEQLAMASRDIYQDVREHILELRTTTVEGGLLAAVRDYVAGWAAQSGIGVQLQLPQTLELPAERELQVLRILQEALTNVRKHSAATEVRVLLETPPGRLRLLVEDDGQGFDLASERPRHVPRFGLKTMAERAAAVGGTLSVDSRPGEGARLELLMPLAVVVSTAPPPADG